MNIRILNILTFISTLYFGCGNSNNYDKMNNYKTYYCIIEIDNASFEDYISIFIKTSNQEYKWLLSERLKSGDSIINYFSRYEKLNIDKWYPFAIELIDTTLVLKTKRKPSINVLELNEKVLWQNDTVKTKEIYKSNSIVDIYWGTRK